VRAAEDPAEIASIGAFFERHTIFVHEWLRGDPVASVRPLFVHLLESIASGSMTIPLGSTTPVDAPSA